MKSIRRKFSTLFNRCGTCSRLFRVTASSSAHSPTCRSCRSALEMQLFFEWLDSKL